MFPFEKIKTKLAKSRSCQNTKKMSKVVLYLKRTQLAFISGGDLQQGSKCTVSFLPANTSKCLFAIEVSPCTEAEDDRVTTRSNTLRRMKAVRSIAAHE